MALNIDLALLRELDKLDHNEKVYQYALLYARLGFKVLPQKRDSKGYIKNLTLDHATNNLEIIEHWFGPRGPYEGYNILGVLPDGVIVLDFDTHGAVSGFINSGLGLHDLSGLRVLTPTGGCHFYTSDTKVSFLKKTAGVDKKTAVTMPPSITNEGQYEWDTGGEPGPLTETILEALGGRTPNKKQDKPQEFATVAPPEFIRELLTFFDPGAPYDEWCNVGMAIHDNDPGQANLDLWIDWSEQSEKFKPGECERRWETFSIDKNRKVTLAWMIYHANQRGREPTIGDVKYSGINLDAYNAVMKMNESYMVTTLGGSSIICITEDAEGNPAYNRTSAGDFKSITAANLPQIMVGDKWVPAAEYWLKSKYRREGKIVMEYPGKENPGDINVFRGFAIKPVPCHAEEIQFFLDHTLEIICNGNREHFEFLLDMLAYKLQNPLDLVGIALVLAGREGTGKSAFGEIFRLIIGPTHAQKVSTREGLLGSYSGGIANMVYVVGEEAIFSAHKSEAERLKALITESPLDWNQKFVKQWSQRNCLFLVVTANENWVIPAGFDSRRFMMLKVSDKRMGDSEYWKKQYMPLLYKNYRNEPNNPEYLGKILHFFLVRKITHDLSKAPVTAELVEQRKLTNADSMESAFVNWVRRLFVNIKSDEAVIEGLSKECSFSIVTYVKERYVEAGDLYTDFRQYYLRHHSKGRGCGTEKDFRGRLFNIGMLGIRAKRRSLKVGAGRYPGNPESKIAIVKLPPPDQLEDALAKEYPLFFNFEGYEDAPDDE